jgi:hypothetical protein
MEYCSRPNLAARYRAERLSVAEVLRIGVRIAGAVETAHRAGILHRDIKPANVLTTDFGHPVLSDFGISVSRTSPQALAGTVGDVDPVDGPRDVHRGGHRGRTRRRLLAGRHDLHGAGAAVALRPARRSEPIRGPDRSDPYRTGAGARQVRRPAVAGACAGQGDGQEPVGQVFLGAGLRPRAAAGGDGDAAGSHAGGCPGRASGGGPGRGGSAARRPGSARSPSSIRHPRPANGARWVHAGGHPRGGPGAAGLPAGLPVGPPPVGLLPGEPPRPRGAGRLLSPPR